MESEIQSSTALLTLVLAIWGAVISSVALIWNIVRDSRDGGRIRVYAFIGKLVPDPTNRSYLTVKITNIGRKPIKVNGWGGICRSLKGKENFFVGSQQLPRMLSPGEDIIEHTDDMSLLDENLVCIRVWDSKDHYWNVSRKNLKKLLQDAAVSKLKHAKKSSIGS